MKNPITPLLLAAALGVSAPAMANHHAESTEASTQATLNAAADTKTQVPAISQAQPDALDTDGKPAVVNRVDLPRYMGKWYEIANFPAFFQRKCVANVTADYSLTESGDVTVINACDEADGTRKVAEGLAKSVSDSNAKLKVSFLPKWLRWLPIGKGDYWVLKLDADYQTALVGSPDRKYLWILSRTPSVDAKTYASYVSAAKAKGFDVSKLVKTKQNSMGD